MNTQRKPSQRLQSGRHRPRPSEPVESRKSLDRDATVEVPSKVPLDEMDCKDAASSNRSSTQGSASVLDKAADEAGYCKPPKHHQWKPGESGNPKGRPKKSSNFSTMLTKEARRLISVTENGRTRKASVNEVVLRGIANAALKGDPRATKLWLDMMARFVPEDTEALARETLSANDIDLLEQMFALDRAETPGGTDAGPR